MKPKIVLGLLWSVAIFGIHNSAFAQLSQKDSLLQISRNLPGEIPSPRGLVNDFEQVFSELEIDSLSRLIFQLNKELNIQLAVVTLDSTYTNAKDFDAFSLALANKWGIGESKKNNGILIAISKSFRKIRIHNGFGIERILSDAETAEIVNQQLIPNFKTGNFFKGTVEGIEKIKVRIIEHK